MRPPDPERLLRAPKSVRLRLRLDEWLRLTAEAKRQRRSVMSLAREILVAAIDRFPAAGDDAGAV
jgi:hypothetical protein